MIWMQPITTTDLYGYVARGYLYAHLHQNPMITPAQLLPGGILVDRPAAPYGPVWLLIAGAVSLVAGENLLLNMLLFKVIAAVWFLAPSSSLMGWRRGSTRPPPVILCSSPGARCCSLRPSAMATTTSS